ncbi:hypothetical protein OUZ56_003798 [Daphnia magna]|uniref:Uncharacterized protein n=1 Tax=Daphnia magna TaxID=35525 RepID=A0ABQ9YMT3_9CRUS|nr:hypothetical protein OUZ56_003798 [Daphnia magna]
MCWTLNRFNGRFRDRPNVEHTNFWVASPVLIEEGEYAGRATSQATRTVGTLLAATVVTAGNAAAPPGQVGRKEEKSEEKKATNGTIHLMLFCILTI